MRLWGPRYRTDELDAILFSPTSFCYKQLAIRIDEIRVRICSNENVLGKREDVNTPTIACFSLSQRAKRQKKHGIYVIRLERSLVNPNTYERKPVFFAYL